MNNSDQYLDLRVYHDEKGYNFELSGNNGIMA